MRNSRYVLSAKKKLTPSGKNFTYAFRWLKAPGPIKNLFNAPGAPRVMLWAHFSPHMVVGLETKCIDPTTMCGGKDAWRRHWIVSTPSNQALDRVISNQQISIPCFVGINSMYSIAIHYHTPYCMFSSPNYFTTTHIYTKTLHTHSYLLVGPTYTDATVS